jgi:4-hydroxy-tetrahydrodipicolinate synthase
MAATRRFQGVIAPLVTPFGEDGAPDPDRFISQADWLMRNGCTGLAPFGTTSEANSLGLDERMELLEELVDAGIEAGKLLPGTGMCAVTDAIALTQHAVEAGCGGVLMLPPFYYKGVSDDGLFAYFSDVIESVGDDRLKVYLYHIPPIAQVGISLPLIARLRKAYPKTIAGLKDSSGDWNQTKAFLAAVARFQRPPMSTRQPCTRCSRRIATRRPTPMRCRRRSAASARFSRRPT